MWTPISLESIVPPKLPPHVVRVRNRSGRPYLYLMRHRGTARAEKAIRLPDDPRSREFWSEYARLMNLPVVPASTKSFTALIEAWHASPEWKQLADKTRVEWTRYSERIKAAWGDLEVVGIEPRHVLALRDKFAATPATANNLLRCLSSMLAWSVPRGWRPDNPCREVKPLKGGEGYAPWPKDVIAAAREELREDLWWCVALALYTGQRLSDVLAMRWDHIVDGRISVAQEKTKKRLLIQIHKDLRAVLDTIPKRAVTILTSSEGTPWRGGFQAVWRKHRPRAVVEAGLVFHGLRKSAVVTLLEAGCTTAMVQSVTGQSLQMVEHYAKGVNQMTLADAAILAWEQNAERTEIANQFANQIAPNRAK
jgi:integrase